MQTDQGPEFKNREVNIICGATTTHIYSHPYAHEEISLIEKARSVLFGKVRAVLISPGLSEAWWGKVAGYIMHTDNRTGSAVQGGAMTTLEILHGMKPDIS